ncbi:type I-F CRISPR-associated endonuclease Cas1f [Halodesulfovibrio sp.]|jgi:CRISPR-associated protein Cas1|uniref:type I-F CRISPR-associated endonuclease Cas1f n=1 Tax=Halodesulfovibrio sp. TaxID=1912772 RepID=UPI0025D23CC2|nr:type I-F CRISPR-associated endonuclease Cas1f [Halodesulfovibrio sp.]MCT4627555.1 type I-F CRISPR-associated endonuclease Cas1f [Halodesulfovibrio sp.]
MKHFSSSELKTIIHSKRANLYYLEHCRVLVNGGRVEYVTEEGAQSLYWNIPIANTTCMLLGTGTSITQAAMRELGKAGVSVGFCGGDGSPLYTAGEMQCDISWMSPQSEYRPTEYLQQWASFWFDDEKRFQAAILFQNQRIKEISKHWKVLEKECSLDLEELSAILETSQSDLLACSSQTEILSVEARMTKKLYRQIAQSVGYGSFTRAKQGTGIDLANKYLDHGNYLAYGLAATTCWVLGLPHSLAVLHGKTRRGGLVFDVADIVKDALVLPQAFIGAMEGDSPQEFRQRCLSNLRKANALDVMIETVQATAKTVSK